SSSGPAAQAATAASAACRSATPPAGRSPTVKCGIVSVNAPPYGRYPGNAAQTARVSARNGSSGRGGRYSTSSPNHDVAPNSQPNALTVAAAVASASL